MKRVLSQCLAAVLLAGMIQAGAGEGDVARIGDLAPVISGIATDGKAVSMDAFKGHVIILGFFATWCSGCVAELPRLEREIYQPYKDAGAMVIEVGRGHTYSDLAQFKASRGFNFVILADPTREIYNRYASDYIPRCYVIGKDGKIKFTSTGLHESDFSEMKQHVIEELAIQIPKITTPPKDMTPQNVAHPQGERLRSQEEEKIDSRK